MKKILLFFAIVSFAYFTNAQVIVAGVSPSSIAGNYPNAWADPAGGWGTPNLLIPGTYIQDTLMLANDGSVGLNAQGNPVSAAACNPLLNNLNGKIAVIYRGDGTTNPTSGGCEFGVKALNAQNAGAVGVIIINREPGVMTPGPGASGATVTIPVVMLSNTDGAILVNQMQSGPVEVFIGNKIGLFANDIRLSTGAALAPKQGFVPALLAQSASEFNFSVGARIYNDGNQPQGNVSLRATVTNPAGNLVYDNSVSAMYIDFNDSIDVDPISNFNLPDFSLSTYPVGTYTLIYTASMTNIVDEFSSDNSISFTFTISESIYSAAKVDTVNGLPNAKIFYRPSTNNQTYSICSVISDPNASRLAVEGLYFAATKGTVVPEDSLIAGEEMNLTLYKWEDAFVDINDANLGFNQLTEMAQAYFYYTDESQEGETVYGAFSTPVVLLDNQRYLACVQTVNINLYMGYDNTNYTWNTDYYLQPICPNESDGTWFTNGFGADVPNAVGIRVISSFPPSAVLSGSTTICPGATTNLSVAVTVGVPPYTVTVTNGTNNYTTTGSSPVSIPVSPTITSTYTIVSVIAAGGAVTGNSGAATVTVIPSSTNTTTATACNSYVWNGQNYTTSGVYTGTTANCVTQSLNLTIIPSSTNTTTASACYSYTWNGTTYGISGIFTGITANCVTQFLNLTIIPNTTNTTTATACDSYTWNNTTYSSSGTYTQYFQAVNGCDSIVNLNLTVHNNFNPVFSSNQQLFTFPPFAVQFSNTTASIENYTFTWYWGDGTSTTSNNPTVFHQYLSNGLYSVTLEAVNNVTGCLDQTTLTDYIFTTGGVSCSHSSVINQVGPINGCSSQPIIITCNSDPNFTYQWRRNGVYIQGNNNDTLLVNQPGSYSVIISVNGCPVSSLPVVVNIASITAPTISSSGAIQPCLGGSVILSASLGYTNYLWSNGATTQSITVSSSGNFSVQGIGANGCIANSQPYTVNASFLPTQNICVVGVDSLTNNIRVVWEKPLTTAIDSFYVYKESTVSNVYAQVGSRAYDSLSVWIDPISNPAVQAYRYKITALDTCGVETPLSDFHKTIHLTINQGVGGAWNLIWSHYEGINFGSYKIYRGTSLSNMALLTTIQSNLNSYTDLNPPTGLVYYQIEIINPNNCSPTKSTNYSLSKSNIVVNGQNDLLQVSNDFISVYPNPTNGEFIIDITKGLIGEQYYITDFSGKIIKIGKFENSKEKVDIDDFSKGVFMIQIKNRNIQERIIKL